MPLCNGLSIGYHVTKKMPNERSTPPLVASRSQAVSRRHALVTGLALSGSIALAACGTSPGGGPTPSHPSGSPTPTPRRFLGIFPEPPPPSPTPTPPPVVMRFAHWETGLTGKTLATIVDRFSHSVPHVVVELVVAPFRLHFDRLRQGLADRTAPDVFVNSGLYVSELIGRQALLDLTDRLTGDHLRLDGYWTDPGGHAGNGRWYGLPLWLTTEILYYNRRHFDELKIPEPPENWTWSDLLGVARQLTRGKPGQIERWGMLLTNDLQGGWGSFVASNGGDWLDSTGQKAALDESAAIEALQWYADAILVHHVAPRPIEQQRLSRAGQVDPFLSGDVSLFPNGTWEMPSVLSQANIEWDVRRLPRSPRTGKSVAVSSVQPVSARRTTARPDLAWQLLRFLIEREAQTLLAAGKVRMPSLKAVARDQASGYATAPPAHADAPAKSMDTARDLRFVPGWQGFRSAVVQALEPAFDGRLPLTDAIHNAVTEGNAALSSSRPSGTPAP